MSSVRNRTHRPFHAFRSRPVVAAAGLVLASFAGSASAQQGEPVTPAGGDVLMPEVVVSATGYEQMIKDAPASISVITREELQSRQFRDVAEAIRDVEGVDVRGSTGKTGGMDISIRGMPSEYTLILIDGRRQNVAGNVTPNGFSDALTSLIPPVSSIERIEVIRGPMSTLYGSDAMGGVINIITRRIAPQWGGSTSFEMGIPENGDAGNTGKFGFYLDGPLKSEVLGLSVRGSIYRRADSDLQSSSPGGVISQRGPSPTETRQHALGFRLNLTPDRQNDFWLDVEQNRSRYGNEDCELGTLDYIDCDTGAPTTTARGYGDALRFDRDQVAIGHTGRLAFGTLETSLMRNVTETHGRTIPSAARPAGDPEIGTRRELKTTGTVLDSKLVAPIGERHLLAAGGQYWDARLVDGLVPDPYRQKLWALFAEDEWTLLPDLVATLGARYDHHDAFGGHVSPRAYLVWSASPTLTVKGGVSNGFRAPQLNQLVNGVSGISGQGRNINIGNPNLDPEKSTSKEIGAIYDNRAGFVASATAFHNDIDDRIGSGGDCTVAWISSCAANPTATYAINADKAKTWGVELSTRVAFTRQWSASFNYTWTDSELITNGSKAGKLGDTAEHVANAMLRWDASEKWSLWLRAEYRGASRRFDGHPDSFTGNTRAEYLALGDLDGYSLFHLGGQHRVSKNVTLTANIFNLFDRDFRRFRAWQDIDGDTQWGSPYFKSVAGTKGSLPDGRTFWIAANISF